MSRVVLGPVLILLVLALSGCASGTATAPAPTSDPSTAPLADGAEGTADTRTAVAIVPDDDVEAATVDPAEPGGDPVEGEPTEPMEPAARLTLDDLLGEDGRLSVLILGSDKREGIRGERTDAIIVATINPTDGKVAMVSMPRDTVDVPIGPDRIYRDRINTLYQSMKGRADKPKLALKKTRKAFEFAFGTEIDYYALVDFRGLVRLIDSIGGIEVTLDEKLHDPTMHLTEKGLKLKKGDQQLDGKTTLAFARTRHTDSDYGRSRRQQQVLTSTVDRVRERGADALPALMGLVRKKVITDLPLEAAPLLLELAGDARLAKPKSVVLEPGRFARQVGSTFTITPRLGQVRKMFSKAFKPLR